MKKLIVLSAMLWMIGMNIATACGGSALVYDVKVYLKDGTNFKGCFEMVGDGPGCYLDQNNQNEYTNDSAVFELFKLKQQYQSYNTNDTRVAIYEEIHIVQPKPINKAFEKMYLPKLGVVEANKTRFLDSTEIDKMVFWEVNYSERDWTQELLVGPKKMITTLDSAQFWNVANIQYEPSEDGFGYKVSALGLGDEVNDDFYEGIFLVNYNDRNNNEELIRLAKLKFRSGWEGEGDDYMMSWAAMKKWFWKRGVLVMELYEGC